MTLRKSLFEVRHSQMFVHPSNASDISQKNKDIYLPGVEIKLEQNPVSHLNQEISLHTPSTSYYKDTICSVQGITLIQYLGRYEALISVKNVVFSWLCFLINVHPLAILKHRHKKSQDLKKRHIYL